MDLHMAKHCFLLLILAGFVVVGAAVIAPPNANAQNAMWSERPALRPFTTTRGALRKSTPPPVRPFDVQSLLQKGYTLCNQPNIRGTYITIKRANQSTTTEHRFAKIYSASGVVFAPPPIVDCQTADALNRWIAQWVKPAIKRIGGGLKGMRISKHYTPRGHMGTGHEKGQALEIAALVLQNGVVIPTVPSEQTVVDRALTHTIHQSACRVFNIATHPRNTHSKHLRVNTMSVNNRQCR